MIRIEQKRMNDSPKENLTFSVVIKNAINSTNSNNYTYLKKNLDFLVVIK